MMAEALHNVSRTKDYFSLFLLAGYIGASKRKTWKVRPYVLVFPAHHIQDFQGTSTASDAYG